MRRKIAVFWALVLVSLLTACGGSTETSGATSAGKQEQSAHEVVCDVTQFANISAADLVALLGEPDSISETTPATGFVEIPCTYYDYYDTEILGEVSFLLVNDSVVKFTAYHEFPYYKEKELLASLNVEKGEDCAMAVNTDTALRYRCVTDEIDDIWITNIEDDVYGFLAVTYDMLYFEEWYLPMKVSEQSNYQYWTQEHVKSILKAPKSADFPNIGEWAIVKNKFYVAAQSYVDAQNSFGAEVRSTFTFIYLTDTDSVVYAVFDGDVIADNGYTPTADLVKLLVSEMATEKATQATEEKTESVVEPTESESTESEPVKENAKQPNTPTESTGGESNVPAGNPAFTGSTCLDIYTSGSNNGMPKSNVTNFTGTDSIGVAGKFTGLTGENNVKIVWTCPDGYVFTDQRYCYENGDTLQCWKAAEDIGSGSAKVSIVLDTTGQTLATYYFTVTGAPTYTNTSGNANSSTEDPYGEMDGINAALAEQEYLQNLPSLDGIEWEVEYEESSDLDGISTSLTDEELAELESAMWG